jgi:hypothetical protein
LTRSVLTPGADVATTAGKGLTQAAAIAILKRERRVALFQRGTAFYDARRWGVTQPATSGGGCAAANVLIKAQHWVQQDLRSEAALLIITSWIILIFH